MSRTNGMVNTARRPASIEPPIGPSSSGAEREVRDDEMRQVNINAATNSAAETTSSGGTPMRSTSSDVNAGPHSAPIAPPMPISGNSLRACALSNTSAITLQNSDTTNRLNTLTQM